MACRITTEQVLEILDEELDVGLNMEYGVGDESDSDVDDTFLEERIWDDLEYNEDGVLDNSFGECDSSSSEGGDIENDTGNRTRTGHCTVRGCFRGRGTDGRGQGILRGSGTVQQRIFDTSRRDDTPRRRHGPTGGRGIRGRGQGRRQSTQDMNLNWMVIF